VTLLRAGKIFVVMVFLAPFIVILAVVDLLERI
jgi:hypothetical protein